MYRPPVAGQKSVFWAFARIAFVISAVILWTDEHAKVVELSSQLKAKPSIINSPQINVPPAQIVFQSPIPQSRKASSATEEKHTPPAAKEPPLSGAEEKPQPSGFIRTITVEGRLTCDLKDGAELPPSSVDFVPIGDAAAHLIGSSGNFSLAFVSPVVFRRQQDGKMIVINTFAASPASDLMNKPFQALAALDTLQVPSVTVAWGHSIKSMSLFEVTVTINGSIVWYYPYRLGEISFQEGPAFKIPIDGLRKQLGL